MNWIKYFYLSIAIYFLQLISSDFLSLNGIRPDFCVILIIYIAVDKGSVYATVFGFILGLFIDFSGNNSLFGLSPLVFTSTGYFSGFLKTYSYRLSNLYFMLSWIAIISIQFFIFSLIIYQNILVSNLPLFIEKYLFTVLYTLIFILIFQKIKPLREV